MLTGYKRQAESGNVLFLILIAVALFAGLSYAVTQSSRGGGDNTGEETSLLKGAQITQYPASVSTSITRMLLNALADVEDLEFNPPVDFGACGGGNGYCVFHPAGGKATFSRVPPDIMYTSLSGTWLFNSQYQITDIGTTAADKTANDLIAFLPGVKLDVCTRMNEKLGILVTDDDNTNGVPDAGSTTLPTDTMNQDSGNTGIGPYDAGRIIGGLDFVGMPFGCADFDDASPTSAADGDLVYFHVLVER